MASILAMGAGALINALCFSGSNFLFSKFSDHGSAERVRHDQAVEKLQKSQASSVRKIQERLDYINEELQRENHAEKTFEDVDEAMEVYYLATRKKLPELPPNHVLSDYYHPSEQQKDGEIAFILGTLVVTGFVMYKYIK